ncbi:MAG: hypothetical protein IPK74_19680 [Deltaproteobacteria bacterium]|nr:hypothetical protein [Deltaproteobacteria bacterium]
MIAIDVAARVGGAAQPRRDRITEARQALQQIGAVTGQIASSVAAAGFARRAVAGAAEHGEHDQGVPGRPQRLPGQHHGCSTHGYVGQSSA